MESWKGICGRLAASAALIGRKIRAELLLRRELITLAIIFVLAALISTGCSLDGPTASGGGSGGGSSSGIALPRTGQTVSYAAGDDGDLQTGVAWPNHRFVSNGDDTTTDSLTGLVWTQDGDSPGPAACLNAGTAMTWQEALDHITCLNDEDYLGFDDWRLPNRTELCSLMNFAQGNGHDWLIGQGFAGVQGEEYWSSTTKGSEHTRGWYVNMSSGMLMHVPKTDHSYRLWPVRPGTGGVVELPRTGQTVSYAAGDDGDLQTGVTWPNPRFVSNGDDTITDSLTGLVWTQDGDSPGPAACPTAGTSMTWQEALVHITCLNDEDYLGFDDWRLPNVNELESLFNAGVESCRASLNDRGFTNVNSGEHWSSTSFVPSGAGDYAWWFNYGTGIKQGAAKGLSAQVWPVRGSR